MTNISTFILPFFFPSKRPLLKTNPLTMPALIPMLSGALLEGYLSFYNPTDGRVFGLSQLLGLPLLKLAPKPLLSLPGGLSITAPIAYNLGVFVAWGAAHSVIAQPWFQQRVYNGTPAPLRALLFNNQLDRVFTVVNAATLLPLVLTYQRNLGGANRVLWQLPLPFADTLAKFQPFPRLSELNGLLLAYDLINVAVTTYIFIYHITKALDELTLDTRADKFLENKPAGSEGKKELVTTGYHGIVRHPLYTMLLASMLLTPRMTLSRAVVIAGYILYLIPGVYFEEKRLDQEFGGAYDRYRKKVPYQFIPFIY